MLVRRKLIRERAVELLDRFDITKAPVGVVKLAERLGARVVKDPAPDDLSGFLLRNTQKNVVIIGVNENHSLNRRRFTIGHELGHFLLHKGEELHVDKRWSGYHLKKRSAESSAGTDIEEMEANLFAAELLMPVSFLDRDLEKLAPLSLSDEQKIKKLAELYKVSEQALTLRLTYLEYIQQ